MDPALLTPDEVQYELALRENFEHDEIDGQIRALRNLLRNEEKLPYGLVNEINFEIGACERKFKELTDCTETELHKQGRRFHTRFLHLFNRYSRLSVDDPSTQEKIKDRIRSVRLILEKINTVAKKSNNTNIAKSSQPPLHVASNGGNSVQNLASSVANNDDNLGAQTVVNGNNNFVNRNDKQPNDNALLVTSLEKLSLVEQAELEKARETVDRLTKKSSEQINIIEENADQQLLNNKENANKDDDIQGFFQGKEFDEFDNYPQNRRRMQQHRRPDFINIDIDRDEFLPQGRSTDIFGNLPTSRMIRKSVPVYKWGVKFSGDGKGLSLSDFLSQIEMLAITEKVLGPELLSYAVYLFSSNASMWYQASYKKFRTWQDLVRALKIRFLPPDHDYWLLKEVEKRLQGVDENFSAYLATMELYFQRFTIPLTNQEQLNIVLRNIRPFYSEKLALVEIDSIADLSAYCRRIENVKYNLDRRFSSKPTVLLEPALSYRSRTIGEKIFELNLSEEGNFETNEHINESVEAITKYESQTSIKPIKRGTILCWNCRTEGHRFNYCPSHQRRLFCYKCGREGVVTPECPRCKNSIQKKSITENPKSRSEN